MKEVLWVICLAFLFSAELLQSSVKPSISCHSDFHFQQKFIPHHLPDNIINELEELTRKPEVGWKLLGEHGDAYAEIAEKVLQSKFGSPYFFYRKLIRNHWRNTAGDEEMNRKFYLVAMMHYTQYIQIIKTGYWPDSDQILNSYLNAIRYYHLRDITVFDAAWDAAGMNKIKSWQSLNHLSSARSVIPTMACFSVDRAEARRVLEKDFKMSHARLKNKELSFDQ
jgi:hypothetical protein